jgi:PIN domain nuclease of toxin-antitoxin system
MMCSGDDFPLKAVDNVGSLAGHLRRAATTEPPLVSLIERALPLAWTRDPFDRLLAAHSLARRVPLCTADRAVLARHRLDPDQLR